MLQRTIAWLFIFCGAILLAINIYGLSQEIRPKGLWDEDTRFKNDYSIPYKEAIKQLKPKPDESELVYAQRITHVIAQSITHIHWGEEPDNTRFNQLVPIWENYFLYFMGLWSGIPEYEKYHFTDYKRSIKRGIGLCGDTSMILSQVLEENKIETEIMVFPEHVVLQAKVDGDKKLFDADYGVSIPYSAHTVKHNIPHVAELYRQQGYTPADERLVYKIYSGRYIPFNDVKHFVTKKYYFEKFSYIAKWPLPIIFLISGLISLFRMHKKKYS